MVNIDCQLDMTHNHFRNKLLSMLRHQVKMPEIRRPTLIVWGTILWAMTQG